MHNLYRGSLTKIRAPVTLLTATLGQLSAVTVKWKCLGATTTQPRSRRPHNLTEKDH